MKKFRHRITGEIITYQDGVIKAGNCCIETGVEPSSNSWEEIAEKDYEILKEVYSSKFGQTEYKIISVKRLSDGEIFTVGDKPDNKFPIAEFRINDVENTITVSSYFTKGSSGYYNRRLKNVVKLKQPLFTTKDGVDIFEGDEYFEANLTYGVKSWTTEYPVYFNKDIAKTIFSTKEKAEEYILMNKTCLSLNDLLDAWGNVGDRESYKQSIFFNNFKKAAQNKIKNE